MSWQVGDELVSKRAVDNHDCPHKAGKILFDYGTWHEIQLIANAMGSTEFAVYLLGRIDNTTPMVTGYYLPEQTVNSARVDITEDFLPEDIAPRVIGHLHSHHGMGAFHSGQDEESMNYQVNIVISNSGYVANTRLMTPCGCWMRQDKVPIEFVFPDAVTPDISKIHKEVLTLSKWEFGDERAGVMGRIRGAYNRGRYPELWHNPDMSGACISREVSLEEYAELFNDDGSLKRRGRQRKNAAGMT